MIAGLYGIVVDLAVLDLLLLLAFAQEMRTLLVESRAGGALTTDLTAARKFVPVSRMVSLPIASYTLCKARMTAVLRLRGAVEPCFLAVHVFSRNFVRWLILVDVHGVAASERSIAWNSALQIN